MLGSMPELKELMTRSPRWTLAVAESLTAGRVQARVAAVSGASEYFLGGITAYTIDQKVKHLGVNRATAAAVNCVSATVAEQMAVGACALFGSDLAVATTGYAEPAPALGVVRPFAWWALARRQAGGVVTTRSGRIEQEGLSRVEMQTAVAEAAVEGLVLWLRELRRG